MIRRNALHTLLILALLLAGARIAEAATPLVIDTSSVSFGSVNVGNTSPAMAVTVTNTSAAPFGPLNIFGGAPPTPAFNASQNCQGATLAAGGTCTITYTFAPPQPGTFTDTSAFTISGTASQADGTDFSVALSGVGVNPLAVTPLSQNFGNVNVGNTSATLATTVTNTSSQPFGPLNIFGGAPGAPFSASQNCQGTTLSPGASCTISYTFSPTAPGPASGTSTFTLSATPSQSAGTTFSVALSGMGVNPLSVTPLSQNFGNVNVGSTSAPLSTTITNTSSQPFGPLNIFGGAPGAPFSASQNCQGTTLSAGGSCTISYTFSPTVVGPATGTSAFTISATASQSAGTDFSVALAGCGVDAAQPCPVATTTTLACSPATLAFGNTVTCTATVTPQGGGPAPTGQVTFSVDAVAATTIPVNAGGQAVFATNALGVGSHSIGAAYASNVQAFLNSASAPFSVVVTAVVAQEPAAPIPTLSTLGQWVLALLVALAGLQAYRRRG